MEAFLGTILPWPMNWAPVGWALCDGSLLPISQNQALFSLIGTKYGGNGTSNFALPNLCGRMPIGIGQGVNLPPVTLGQAGGNPTVTLTTNTLPAHNHPATFTPGSGGAGSLSVSTATPTAAPPSLTNGQTAYLANATGGAVLKGLYTTTAPAPDATATIPVNGGSGGTVTVGSSGLGQPLDIHPPFLGMGFIICTNGFYPARP